MCGLCSVFCVLYMCCVCEMCVLVCVVLCGVVCVLGAVCGEYL